MLVKFSDRNKTYGGYINELELEHIPRKGETVSLKDARRDDYFSAIVNRVIWILDSEIPFVIVDLLRE